MTKNESPSSFIAHRPLITLIGYGNRILLAHQRLLQVGSTARCLTAKGLHEPANREEATLAQGFERRVVYFEERVREMLKGTHAFIFLASSDPFLGTIVTFQGNIPTPPVLKLGQGF